MASASCGTNGRNDAGNGTSRSRFSSLENVPGRPNTTSSSSPSRFDGLRLPVSIIAISDEL